ncbi:MAG: tetratricopeptide repeat protein, partial [Anaerolineales bacterium]
DQTAEAELVGTATAKALFPLLRRLMTTDARSAFVFVVGRRAEDLSIDFNATFKASLVREIWVIDDKSAEALVRQAQTNGTLKFTDDAIQRILSLTNHHPYLTQLLCQRVWELAYASGLSSPAEIDGTQVETALESSLEAGNQALDWLWSGLNPAEKIYASALAEIAGENETIPEERIIEVLAAHAARLRTREVELAPRDLVKRHVLDVSGERGYRFAVELFRRWVHKNKALIVVKDEVDRIDPMADRLFVFGNGFYDARQWEKAAFYFREALNVNPRHFRARLYLGETLLEQGKVDEAIAELDQAHILDREEARLPLARAWLAKAEMLKSSPDLDSVFQAYERVLELSPREGQALQGRIAIWRQRAQQAEERGDLIAALEAFRQAGDQSNIDRLDKIARERTLIKLKEQAQQHIKAGHWEAAEQVYSQMVELSSNDASRLNWQAELEKARTQAVAQSEKAHAELVEQMKGLAQTHEQRGEWMEAVQAYEKLIEVDGEDAWNAVVENARYEQEMADIFEQGRQALMQEDWKEAQRLFAQLIQMRPDYSRNRLLAAILLQDAITHRKGRGSQEQAWLTPRAQAWLLRFTGGQKTRILQPPPLPLKDIKEQSAKQRRPLRTAEKVVIGIIGLLVTVSALYNYFQKPLNAGDVVTDILLPAETITAANAHQLYKLGGLHIDNAIVDTIAISPDSSLLAVSADSYSYSSSYYQNFIVIVQIDSGTVLQTLYSHSGQVDSLDFSPDGSLLATGSQDDTIKLWNVQTGELVRTLEGHNGYRVASVAFSPDGSLLASGSTDDTVRLWQVSDGSLVRTLEGHSAPVNSVAFSPDGSLLASTDDYSSSDVRIWQVSDGTLLAKWNSYADQIEFSADGRSLAEVGYGVEFWGK